MLAESARRGPIPIIALGGIIDDRGVRACLEAGAAGVAVMGAIMRAVDPAATMADLVQAAVAGESLGRRPWTRKS
jgi:thiamine monophosphate synthase